MVLLAVQQRCSRGHKARGQGQGHKKNRGQESPSEDRPSRGQGQECSGPRTQARVFSKKKFFSGDLQTKTEKKVLQKFLLVLKLRSRGFYVQAFVDDLAVLVTGADMLWIRGMTQKAINIAANWASEQELQFST